MSAEDQREEQEKIKAQFLKMRQTVSESNLKMGLASLSVQAAAEGNLETLQELQKNGADMNTGDYDRRTPLHLAAAEGHEEIVKWLVSQDVDLARTDRWGSTPLIEAMKTHRTDIVELLKSAFTSNLKVAPWSCENDKANFILLNDATRVSGSVSSALQDVTNSEERRKHFDKFYYTMKQKGISVASVQDIVLVFSGLSGFEELIIDQLQCLSITRDDDITASDIFEFKKAVIAGMNAEQLAFAAMNRIIFKVIKTPDDRLMAKSYEIEPLWDLLQTRLQMCTPKGCVLVGAEDKKFHTNLLRFILSKLGLPIIGSIPDPLRMSGGDYIPAGEELCFMGAGLLTDEASIRYMLQKDLFGHQRVAVVRDLFDRSPARKHLDSVFKIIGNKSVIVLESILGDNNLRRRLVDEYVRVGPKRYEMTTLDMEFGEYLESVGFHVIELPEQLYKDGISIINFGEGRLMVSDPELKALLEKDKEFGGTVELGGHFPYDFISKASLMFRSSSPAASPKIHRKTKLEKVWDTRPSMEPSQTTDTILMVAPIGFQTNIETAADNYFMKKTLDSAMDIERKALLEFSAFHRSLIQEGVRVLMFASERFHRTPDAVFPNNWFSTHPTSELGESTVVFYPMKTESRRNERRQNIISELQNVYKREISFTQWENSDFPHFLESTGVLIMDRVRKIAYAALSKRCYSKIAHTWATKLGYELCLFKATDLQGRPIYHTNVLMSVGTSVAIVCLEAIENEQEKEKLVATLNVSHTIIPITREQMNHFCGNVLEVSTTKGKRIMVMSTRAYDNFTEPQKRKLLKHVDSILHADIHTIETIGGGGVRCMMGELF